MHAVHLGMGGIENTNILKYMHPNISQNLTIPCYNNTQLMSYWLIRRVHIGGNDIIYPH